MYDYGTQMQAVSARMGTAWGSVSKDLSGLPFPVLGYGTQGEETMMPKDPIKAEEYRKKMSDTRKGMVFTESHRNNLSLAKRGKPLSEEHRKSLSIAGKGRVFLEETRNRISKALKGKRATDEHRHNLSVANKGKNLGIIRSQETRRKMSLARKGKPGSMVGKHHSKETKRKLSESHKGDRCYNWKGGVSFEPYCPKFTKEFKERVRAFFGYQCRECGHVWQPGETRLAVHHVNFRKDSCCADDAIPLFVPLCSNRCHSRTNHNCAFWEYWFTEMINRLYGGKCYFTKEEMNLS